MMDEKAVKAHGTNMYSTLYNTFRSEYLFGITRSTDFGVVVYTLKNEKPIIHEIDMSQKDMLSTKAPVHDVLLQNFFAFTPCRWNADRTELYTSITCLPERKVTIAPCKDRNPRVFVEVDKRTNCCLLNAHINMTSSIKGFVIHDIVLVAFDRTKKELCMEKITITPEMSNKFNSYELAKQYFSYAK